MSWFTASQEWRILVQEPCEKRGDDLKQIATEWISTEIHSNHHGMLVGSKRPLLSIKELILSALEVSMNFQQKKKI